MTRQTSGARHSTDENRSVSPTRGTGSVATVTVSTTLGADRVNAISVSSACGGRSASEFRKTPNTGVRAVPGSANFRSASGQVGSCARMVPCRMCCPVRQITMIVIRKAANATGTYPPSMILVAVARKNARATTKNPIATGSSRASDQCQTPTATAQKPMLVSNIVPATAKTYAEASDEDDPKVTVRITQTTPRPQFTSGM